MPISVQEKRAARRAEQEAQQAAITEASRGERSSKLESPRSLAEEADRRYEPVKQRISDTAATDAELKRLNRGMIDAATQSILSVQASNAEVLETVLSRFDAIEEALSTSQQPEPPSTVSLDEETGERLREIETTLAKLIEALDRIESTTPPLASRPSDVDLSSLTSTVRSAVETTMASASEALKVNVRIDHHQLAKSIIERLGADDAGASKAAARLEREAQRMSRAVTISAVGKLAAAMIPLALILVALTIVSGVVTTTLGIGPLYAWAWGSFVAAESHWIKALIATVTLGLTGLVAWFIVRPACEWLHSLYRRM